MLHQEPLRGPQPSVCPFPEGRKRTNLSYCIPDFLVIYGNAARAQTRYSHQRISYGSFSCFWRIAGTANCPWYLLLLYPCFSDICWPRTALQVYGPSPHTSVRSSHTPRMSRGLFARFHYVVSERIRLYRFFRRKKVQLSDVYYRRMRYPCAITPLSHWRSVPA